MKHAGQEALDELEDVLEKVRRHPVSESGSAEPST
jgi:hypothetical protein